VGTPSRSNRFAGVQVAEDADEFFEVFELVGFFPSPRRELSPRPMPVHAPLRGRIEGGDRLAETVTIAHPGFVTSGNPGAFFSYWRPERQEAERFLPMTWNRRSAEGESGEFGLAVDFRIRAMADIPV